MFDLASARPDLVTIADIGDSYLKRSGSRNDFGVPDGGYDIYAMNITAHHTSSSSSSDSHGSLSSYEKGKMLLTSGVHAREYAPPELNMRFAESLVGNYDVDADVTWLLRRTEVHFIIYVNPDGRYVAENNRKLRWRKNLNPRGGCDDEDIGVDINRNFDFFWGDRDGASDDPCDSDYHGRSAESEPETQAVVNYAKALFPEGQRKSNPMASMNDAAGEEIMGMFCDIHSSGGYVYYPWAHEDKRSPDDDALQALGRKLSYFNDYKFWAPGFSDFVYPASGESSDYMYGALSVASFGLELGEDFYEDCDLFEREVVPINLPALLYGAKIATRPFHLVKGPDILELEITPSEDDGARGGGDTMRVSVVASDSAMVKGRHFTGDQGVANVRLYLDVHPDDHTIFDVAAWEISSASSSTERQTFELDVISMEGVSSGRHILYAQAVDTEGYLGPVSSIFFDVERKETASPSKDPTARPSQAPTNQPTPEPSQAPSMQPSKNPTTKMPTGRPSQSPSTTNPTGDPTPRPTYPNPSKAPSGQPTASPSSQPTMNPTRSPSSSPTVAPTKNPSKGPSNQPTASPSSDPTTSRQTLRPTRDPSSAPSPSPKYTPNTNPPKAPSYNNPTVTPSIEPPADTITNVEAPALSSTGNASNARYPPVAFLVASFLLLYLG